MIFRNYQVLMNKMLQRMVGAIVFLLLGLVAGPGLGGSVMASTPDPLVSAEQFRADIRFVRQVVGHHHPNLRFSASPEALEQAYQTRAEGGEAAITRDEAWRRLATLNPLFADAHLFVGYADWRASTRTYLSEGGTLFPYEVEFRNDQLFIRELLGGAETPLRGARIVAINGVPADKLGSTLLERMHGDTPLFRSTVLAQRWWFYYWKMFGAAASYRLTVLRDGDTRSIEVPGSRAMPWLLKSEEDFDQQFRLDFQADGSAVLRIGSFAPVDRARFFAFTREAFTRLHQAATSSLFIDISANGGGDDSIWIDGLMPYLATRAYRTGSKYKVADGDSAGAGTISTWHLSHRNNPLLFKGRTQVVIGPATYSSAVLFANVMQDFGFATLVGSGGAARRTQSGGVRQFILPWSGLALWVPRFVLEPPAGAVAGALLVPSASLVRPRSRIQPH